jgi:Asp-tRNA(Asn)/Glu-tRNA(Gln) amidotransferase A subunit family amidase
MAQTLPAHTFLKTYPALHAPRGTESFRFSIKDLFDVAGEVTTAGSKVMLDGDPAKADAVAVARLKAAGGVAVGRTNMSEFAFSGVGFNPHYGTPVNPMALAASPSEARVTGGSSSGAAASVACKLGGDWIADIGLGSDTGGSLRIPAALCGLVGFKSTARLVPTTGALPLSTTLDTVGAITRDVDTAIKAHEILAARKVARLDKPLNSYRVAVVDHFFTDGIEDEVANTWKDSLQALQDMGLQITTIQLPELFEIADINKTGGFSPMESYQWHKHLIAKHGANYDPRVLKRIMLGQNASELDYLSLIRARNNWIARVTSKLAGFDAVISPTVPIQAPTIASIETDDTEFFRVNGLLLRNPSAVNFLDGCAIALPPNLMLWQAAMHDDAILNLGLRIEELLGKSVTA